LQALLKGSRFTQADDYQVEIPAAKRRRLGKELKDNDTTYYFNPIIFQTPNCHILGYHYTDGTMDLQILNRDDASDCWEAKGIVESELSVKDLVELYNRSGFHFGRVNDEFVADFGEGRIVRKSLVQMDKSDAAFALAAFNLRLNDSKNDKQKVYLTRWSR